MFDDKKCKGKLDMRANPHIMNMRSLYKTCTASQQNLVDAKNLRETCVVLEQRLEKLEQKLSFLITTPRLDMQKISVLVAKYYGIPLSLMLSSSREMEYARPRQVAMYLSRNFLHCSYATIANFFSP